MIQGLGNKANTQLIYSTCSSGHPQSQGKSERSLCTWKEKLRRDILSTKTEEIVIGWLDYMPFKAWHRSIRMSPYKCMFGVKSNHILNRHSNANVETNIEVMEQPSVKKIFRPIQIKQMCCGLKLLFKQPKTGICKWSWKSRTDSPQVFHKPEGLVYFTINPDRI